MIIVSRYLNPLCDVIVLFQSKLHWMCAHNVIDPLIISLFLFFGPRNFQQYEQKGYPFYVDYILQTFAITQTYLGHL